jgi:toxin ParE1/3/4
MRVVWSPRAKQRLEEIAATIAADQPLNARRVVERIVKRTRILRAHPYAGRVLEPIDEPSLRELIESTYRIIYVVRDDVVEISSVRDTRRALPARFEDL